VARGTRLPPLTSAGPSVVSVRAPLRDPCGTLDHESRRPPGLPGPQRRGIDARVLNDPPAPSMAPACGPGQSARRGCAGSPSPGCRAPSLAPAPGWPMRCGAFQECGAGRSSVAGRDLRASEAKSAGRRSGATCASDCRGTAGSARARIARPAQDSPGVLDLAPEHGDLVPHDQDLGVLGVAGPGEQGKPAEHTQHRYVGESH
jgi:hypothetical protein